MTLPHVYKTEKRPTAPLNCSHGVSVTVINECVKHAFLCFAHAKCFRGIFKEFREDWWELCCVLSCLNVDFID